MARHINGLLIMALAVLSASHTHAQRRKPAAPAPQQSARATRSDTTIKGTTLEVYQVYQPELKPIVKPELSPALPEIKQAPVPQQYEVPQQTLYYSYRSLPLRPLALGRDTAPLPAQNYALLAGGNLSTILAEAGLGGLHGRDWNAAVQGRYISQDGQTENQVFRSFSLRGSGTYKTGGHILEGGLTAYRNVFGRYGYDHDAFRYSFDDARMPYSAAALSLGAQNRRSGPWGLDYHPQLRIGAFDARQGHETTLDIALPAVKRIDSSLSVQLALNAQLAWTTIGHTGGTNNIVQLAPALDYHKGGFAGHLGVSPTAGEGSGLQLLPDIHAEYVLPEQGLSFSAGWQAQIIQNTLQQLTKANPYILPDSNARIQTRRSEVFGAVSLALGKHLSVWGRAAWQRFDPLPLFITELGGDGKDFTVIYAQDVQAIVWGGGLRYAIGEDFSLGAEGFWYNFTKHSGLNYVYGEPAVRIKGDASWRITDGLLLTSYLEVLDKIWGLGTAGQDVELRGVFDIGAAAEYTFASRFSVLLRAENLLGRKNERWLGYPSFGFNVYGGLRFRF